MSKNPIEPSTLKAKQVMKEYYDELYQDQRPFREVWEGRVGLEYKVPKEANYLINFLKEHSNIQSILETGAGDGLAAQHILKAVSINKYVATELSQSGVDALRRKGLEAEPMDVTKLKFSDNTFDLVSCFNVMHHVDDPSKMAAEMLRVSKKYFFLSEANGASIPRKILELTPRNRRANENSYLPKTYMNFFEQHAKIKWHSVLPFSFIFAFTPDTLYKPAVAFSELLEKIPLVKWQCSSILLIGEKV